MIGIMNFLGYPSYLDGRLQSRIGLKSIILHLISSFGVVCKSKRILSLIVETAGFEGGFKTVKDYLQPVIRNIILSGGILISISGIYILLYFF